MSIFSANHVNDNQILSLLRRITGFRQHFSSSKRKGFFLVGQNEKVPAVIVPSTIFWKFPQLPLGAMVVPGRHIGLIARLFSGLLRGVNLFNLQFKLKTNYCECLFGSFYGCFLKL